MGCHKCNKISIEECDSELCPIKLSSDCITVKALDCVGSKDGDSLQDVLDIIDLNFCDGGTTPPTSNSQTGTYTINSICKHIGVGNSNNYYTINLTPDFTVNHPIGFTTYLYSGEYQSNISNPVGYYTNGVTDTVAFDINVILLEGSLISYNDGDVEKIRIRIIDSLGNYSDEFGIAVSEINDCV